MRVGMPVVVVGMAAEFGKVAKHKAVAQVAVDSHAVVVPAVAVVAGMLAGVLVPQDVAVVGTVVAVADIPAVAVGMDVHAVS